MVQARSQDFVWSGAHKCPRREISSACRHENVGGSGGILLQGNFEKIGYLRQQMVDLQPKGPY